MTTRQPSPDWNMVELRWSGTYLDGRAAAGTITIGYNGVAPLLDDGPHPVSVFPVAFSVPIRTTKLTIAGKDRMVGYCSVKVPASNDPDIAGGGGSYWFTESLTNGTGRTHVDFLADKDAPGGVIWLNRLPDVGSTPQMPMSVVTYADFQDLQTAVAEIEPSVATSIAAGDVTGLREAVDDHVAAFLAAGSGVTLTHNDAGNVLTISAAGGSAGPVTLATLPAGSTFAVHRSGANWVYGGGNITARPSARTDLTMILIGGLEADRPAWAITGDLHLADAA